MNEVSAWELSVRRGSYLAVGILLIVSSLLPLNLAAGSWPGPDLLYCITMVYMIRRPEFLPVWSVLIVFFLREILTTAPLGLWTMLMVIGTEIVRSNIQAFREYIFGLEWLWVTAIYGGALLIQNIVLSLALSHQPAGLDQFYQFLFTVAAYPIIVAVMRFGFNIQRPPPGEIDAWGHRL